MTLAEWARRARLSADGTEVTFEAIEPPARLTYDPANTVQWERGAGGQAVGMERPMERDPLAELTALLTGSGGGMGTELAIAAGVWAMLGVATGLLAHSRGRDGYDWFAYGLLLWPAAAERTPRASSKLLFPLPLAPMKTLTNPSSISTFSKDLKVLAARGRGAGKRGRIPRCLRNVLFMVF